MKKQTLFVFALMSVLSFEVSASQLKIQGALPADWKIKSITASYGDSDGLCSDGKDRDVVGDIKSKDGIYTAKIKYKEFVKIHYAVFFSCRQYLSHISLKFSSLDSQNNEIIHSIHFESTSSADLVNVPTQAEQNIVCAKTTQYSDNDVCMPAGLSGTDVYIQSDNKLDLQGWNINQ